MARAHPQPITDKNGVTGITAPFMTFGNVSILACDGKCKNARGLQRRPKMLLDATNPADFALLSDAELAVFEALGRETPRDVDQPKRPCEMNEWCLWKCERSSTFLAGQELVLKDFRKRQYNMPWLHARDE